jgi:adenylate cyclase
MHQILSTDILLCEGFRLDRLGLSRLDPGGVASPVALGARALDLAWLLADRQGELISKDEIMETVWPGRVVEENNLTVQISTLRRILDQARAEGSCIQTVVGHGYRFTAAVTRVGADAHSDAAALLPGGVGPRPRLSIVVLPFTNLSDDHEQQYFADGITEDLTTDLSRIAGMFVISRNTAFTYLSKPVDTMQIGRELGVRYVLAGSVQRSGSRVRVTARLIDAETDSHLWAERFDGDMSDLFALQDEITSRIAVALDLELVIAEAVRVIEHPEALDYISKGRAALHRPPTADRYVETINLFERALAVDPCSVEAQGNLAVVLVARALDEMADLPVTDIARADGLIGQALATSPGNPTAHFAKGLLLRFWDRYEEAILEYETVLATNRNAVYALADIGRCKIYIGLIDEGIPLVEEAIRLSPRDPFIGHYYFRIGEAHLLQSRTDEAIFCFEKARSANPALPYVHAHLTAAYALNDESARAAVELAEARRLVGDDRYSSIARLQAVGVFGVPKVRALFETTFFTGLRKAGMPEE